MRKTSNIKVTSAVAVVAALVSLLPAIGWARNPEGGSHDRAYLGVHVSDVPADRLSDLKLKDAAGALILSIDQDGPACKAGLLENDVIMAVNGKKVQNPDQLAELMTTVPAGKAAIITVWRSGQPKEMKVVPGSRNVWMAHRPEPSMAFAAEGGVPAPMPPMAMPAMSEMDIPVFTPAATRNGLMVESLTPQLAEFFGVPRGQGVLVRSVQKGTPGANAGVRAGDVIVKVNGKEVHDLEDWRSNLRSRGGKVSLGIVRDKHAQTLEMTIPGPSPTSEWHALDNDELQKQMNALQNEMKDWQPQFDQQAELATEAMLMNRDDLEQMQRDVDKSMKKIDPELKKQTREIEKSMKQMEPELRKHSKEIQKQMQKMQPEIERQTREARKRMEILRPELEKQMTELHKQMEIMGPEIAKNAAEMAKAAQLNAAEMKKMGESIQEQMKTLGPEIQKQMEEFRKQMEQMQQDWGRDGAKPNEL